MRRRAWLLVVVFLAPAAARAADDYAPQSEEWNGLSDLTSIAAARGLTIETRTSLRWSEIGAGDVLVLLYPTVRVEPAHLAAFLRNGGRALIADDFGKADEALARLGILRRAPHPTGRLHEGNANLPIATASGDHPLSRGVGEITTNHPSAFAVSPGPDVVFSFGGRDEAVVVAGQLGEGRFVALADPSVLINAMLAFDGNLAFAVNLLDFLTPTRPAKLLIISGDAAMAGEPLPTPEEDHAGLSLNDALGQVSHLLDELNDYVAPEAALRVAGWAVGFAVLIAGAAALARSARREPDATFARVAGDPQGPERLQHELDREVGGENYAYPAALLRENAEPEIEAAAAAGARGATQRALVALRRLPTRNQAVGTAVHVSRREFVLAHTEVTEARRS